MKSSTGSSFKYNLLIFYFNNVGSSTKDYFTVTTNDRSINYRALISRAKHEIQSFNMLIYNKQFNFTFELSIISKLKFLTTKKRPKPLSSRF